MEGFRKNEELNAKLLRVMGSSEAPLDRRIEDINTKIKSCDKFLTQTLKADSEEPTCDSIVAAIFNRTATDATEYDGLTKKLEDMELSEWETLDTCLELVRLYIERSRLRRTLMEKTETTKADMEATNRHEWHSKDHCMILNMELDGMSTLARLLPSRGHDDSLAMDGMKMEKAGEADKDKAMGER